MNLEMFKIVGDFGEDKDTAAYLRQNTIKPTIAKNQPVYIDFAGVTLVTQSFIHALISDVLRVNGENALKLLRFENCVDLVKGIISTVVQYSLDSMSEEELADHKTENDEENGGTPAPPHPKKSLKSKSTKG